MTNSENVCQFIVKTAFGSAGTRSVVLIGSRNDLTPTPATSIDRSFDTIAEFGGCQAHTVIVSDALDNQKPDRVASALASLRNRLIPRIVYLPLIDTVPTTETYLKGLGFVLSGQLATRQIWSYELSSDNLAREWNNTDNWANPQNFDAGRW